MSENPQGPSYLELLDIYSANRDEIKYQLASKTIACLAGCIIINSTRVKCPQRVALIPVN
jgi:hypothetical protein